MEDKPVSKWTEADWKAYNAKQEENESKNICWFCGKKKGQPDCEVCS